MIKNIFLKSKTKLNGINMSPFINLDFLAQNSFRFRIYITCKQADGKAFGNYLLRFLLG